MPLGPDLSNNRRQISGELISVPRNGRLQRLSAFPGPLQRRRTVGVAKLNAAGLGGCQRLTRSLGDQLAFGLGDQRHDAHCEVVRLGHVAGGEETPLSLRVSRKAALRDSRSCFAMTSVAWVRRASFRALSNSGRWSCARSRPR